MVLLSILVLLLVSGDTVSADVPLVFSCEVLRIFVPYGRMLSLYPYCLAGVFFLAVFFILHGHVACRSSFADLCVPVYFYGSFFSGPFRAWVVLVSLCLSSLQKLVVGVLYPSAHDNTSAFW